MSATPRRSPHQGRGVAIDVLHANWTDGRVHLWGESAQRWRTRAPLSSSDAISPHPFALDAGELKQALIAAGLTDDLDVSEIAVRLPSAGKGPLPSSRFAHAISFDEAGPGVAAGLEAMKVPTLAISPDRVEQIIGRLEDFTADVPADDRPALMGDSIRFMGLTCRLSRHLMAQERLVPTLRQDSAGDVRGAWQPWLSDEGTALRIRELVQSMPASVRSCVDELDHDPWVIVSDMTSGLIDAHCRRVLIDEEMGDTIEGRDRRTDMHVAWLEGLLGDTDQVSVTGPVRSEMIKRVRLWIGRLDERGASTAWRLCFKLNEPMELGILKDLQPPDESIEWTLSFHLQSIDDPSLIVDAADVWLLPSDSLQVEGKRIDQPQELLLGELGRASRLLPWLENALTDSEPIEISLPTSKAYEFLREHRPVLSEQGFGAIAPDWWESPAARLGARLRIEGKQDGGGDRGEGDATRGKSQLGLDALVNYTWEIAVGDMVLSLREFEDIAEQRAPLVRVGGRWVEIRPEDVRAALKFIRENPGGEMSIGEAVRLAYSLDRKQTGVPVVGMESTGWVSAVFDPQAREKLPELEHPTTFQGVLRPYQLRGVSWLGFLEKFGFGACLADDMGLGKTIQLLALMAHDRETRAKMDDPPRQKPSLLVVPMSVVGNWLHETERFCPHFKAHIHHGIDRPQGQDFFDMISDADLVITTYALAHRDREMLECVEWERVVLDEAQFVKNAQSKQSQAVRSFKADKRAALTGTPVENRLSELWSIMDFLNPGYLGGQQTFRKRFAIPIERYHDPNRAEALRALVRPFILRRLKSDPTVIPDLPEKVESKEYSHLTGEQARLYEACVTQMLQGIERAEGIHRRGLVLAALIKLKQICNHPSQVLKDHDFSSATAPDPSRSGKCLRILEMLDEVLASGEKAIVFTQFRQMGLLLSAMLRHELDRDVLYLHGGTPQQQRVKLVEQFQHEDPSRNPIMLVSLKAGGVGLNLTAATHVFHFDRWWNPAVENQATDRAYRIGQTRTVQVHKFVVRGTLEERIDQMIEEKTELAESIIGSGERWLTELDTNQLAELLSLRSDAVDD